MSIIKSIKQVLGLGPAAENHFWDGSVANQLTLKRGTPDAPGAELIKALNGVLSFPNQGQSLTPNGYVVLPGGLIIQWGTDTQNVGYRVIDFNIEFPTATLVINATANSSGVTADNQGVFVGVNPITKTGFACSPRFISPGGVVALGQSVYWIAIGY